MQNQIRYVGDGRNSAWFLPFPVSEPRDITVSRTVNGEERRLACGTDYQLAGSYLHAFLPDGAILAVWLNEAPENVDRKAREASLAAPASAGEEGEPAASVAARLEANLARSDALLRDAETQCRLILAEAREQARQMAVQAREAALDGIREEGSKISASASRAEGSAQETAGYLNMASAAAREAEDAAREANARAANICDCAEASGEQAALAAKSADLAWDGAKAAWAAACAASQHHFRPGISAVHSPEEISCCAHGLFIVNPYITHSPTPFMGIWPVEDLAGAAWDGVFFIGEKYPCPCALPPECHCPEKPELPPDAATGDADDWQPCGHRHQDKKCPCRD